MRIRRLFRLEREKMVMGVGTVHSSCPFRKGYPGEGENGIRKDRCLCSAGDSKDALSEFKPRGNQGGRSSSLEGVVHSNAQLL